MHVIPHSWSHLHILISVFPPIGLLIVLGFFIAASRAGNDQAKKICLALIAGLGLLSLAILGSGFGSQAALTGNARFPAAAISSHLMWSIPAVVLLVVAGGLAGFELWSSLRAKRVSKDPFHLIVGSSVAALIASGIAGEMGFDINHNELQSTVSIADISTSQ